MSDAIAAYAKLAAAFSENKCVETGQMFGKACLKVSGKAFIAQHQHHVVFKISGEAHQTAMALSGATLWDPSGKGRPMKEWVALGAEHSRHFAALSTSAIEYVGAA